jgi:cell wall-associated NlpC family hydrolase
MVSISQLKATLTDNPSIEYQCQSNLNLYDSPGLTSLATQAVTGRQLRILSLPSTQWHQETAIQVYLCEDNYPGWLAIADLDLLEIAAQPYRAIVLNKSEIDARLPQVIAYVHTAMARPNHYLWGGTIGPNYDCSGLVQAAFAAAGIWLPRDAYQQAASTQTVAIEALKPGDLIFFGPDLVAPSGRHITHVGLYLGNGDYIHSSGKDQGRNQIGIDTLSDHGGLIAQTYYRQFRAAGRVITSYAP